MTSLALGLAGSPLAALLPAALLPAPHAARAQSAAAPSLFGAGEVEQERFLVVAAPIGSGARSQLNIYEQIRPTRACFAVAGGRPAQVDPLLANFDFTGICGRYIDGNGYSLRIGDSDLGSGYRLSVVREPADVLLLALPTRPGAGPEMVVARTQGLGDGFLKFEFEPGWRVMRRQFRGRSLGHVYVYRESWPEPAGAAAAGAAVPGAPSPALQPPLPAAAPTSPPPMGR